MTHKIGFVPVLNEEWDEFGTYEDVKQKLRGICIAEAMGCMHCVGKCQEPRDCTATPMAAS